MQQPIKVLIADDHPLLRRGLATVIESAPNLVLVGEAGDGLQAIRLARELFPHVIVMDIFMPVMGGLEATAILSQNLPEIMVMMLTISDKEEDLFSAIKAGAKGYLLKDVPPKEFVDSIVQVAEGGVLITPHLAPRLIDDLGNVEPGMVQPPPTTLSSREKDVLGLVASGLSNREIANKLILSENTVKTHLKNIMDKLHLKNRAHAAAYISRTV